MKTRGKSLLFYSLLGASVGAGASLGIGVFGVLTGISVEAAGSGTVVINEVAWMGTGASPYDEWIELHNSTDSPVDIDDWSIYGADTEKCINFVDADGKKTTTIPGHGYLVYANHTADVRDGNGESLVDIWDATIGLNNGSPGQLLLHDAPDCQGNVVDIINQATGGWVAGKNKKDEEGELTRATMARIDPEASGSDAENWGTSAEEGSNGTDAGGNPIVGTPRAANSIGGSGCEVTSIASVRGQPKDVEVCFEGCVSVRRGALGKDIVYVQDSTAGVRVKYAGDLDANYHKKRLRIEGLRWEAWDEIYVKAEAVWVLNDDCGRIRSKRVNTGDIKDDGDSYEGLLVDLVGEVVETSGDTFWVDDGSGRAKVYLREEAGVKKPTTRVGYQAAIKGIVSQWGSLDNGDPNFRVMPREQGDVEIRQPAEADPTSLRSAELRGAGGAVLGVATGSTLGVEGVNIGSDPMSDLAQLPVTGARPTWRLAVAMLCVGLAGRALTYPAGRRLARLAGDPPNQVRPLP